VESDFVPGSASEKVNDSPPRGWWSRADAARGEYSGLEVSIASLKKVLLQERYVVCANSVYLDSGDPDQLQQGVFGFRLVSSAVNDLSHE
jgi:hypothetical protein